MLLGWVCANLSYSINYRITDDDEEDTVNNSDQQFHSFEIDPQQVEVSFLFVRMRLMNYRVLKNNALCWIFLC